MIPIHNEATHSGMLQIINRVKRTHFENLSDKWEMRFQIVEQFLAYLEEEEGRDGSYFATLGVTKWGKIIPVLRQIYDRDKAEIIRRLNLPIRTRV